MTWNKPETAAYKGHLGVARMRIEHNANINSRHHDIFGRIALHVACVLISVRDQLDFVLSLLEHSADANTRHEAPSTQLRVHRTKGVSASVDDIFKFQSLHSSIVRI
jgi:ankyrin repeat protein